MTCIIVEDIQMAADILKKFCEKSGLLKVAGHFLNVAEALTYLDEHTVDLIFLDVEMPGATGFELLDNLTFKPKIILTTSKTEYAFEAFQYSVDDYLKKPFTYKRFIESVEKIQKEEPVVAPSLGGKETDHLFIKVDTKLVKLINSDILFVESMGDYVKFVTSTKKYVTLNTLKNLEEKLNKSTFIKVHRSYIVNIAKIDDLQGNVVYIQGNEVPIGKGHREEVMKRLNIV
ncbi:MAG: LytTR family DNA-binding domain-containing protein [Flavisolibacter sp.]